MESGKSSKIDLKSLPDPGTQYKLGLKIGGGVGGDVFEAIETDSGKKVAIKTIELKAETENEIKQEFQILKTLSGNENFPEFYGIFLKKGKDNVQRVWMVMEFCEGGTAADFARKLEQEEKKKVELYVAYIMRETIKAVIHLHENEISHRDIRGSNVLLTADGRVKLADFGISKRLKKDKKMETKIGSPNWMAPEVIAPQGIENGNGYDKKADVWALGITAIELGDGQPPFEDMHPARALFQIVQAPPPTLRKPRDWSLLYNDFINECLVKNPENRPFVQELLAHTFFEPIDAEENVQNDIKVLLERQKNLSLFKKPEIQIRDGYLKIEQQSSPEKILQEDLAALYDVSEDSVLMELHERFKKQEFQTFVGDILLILNPNKKVDIYGDEYHKKYLYKGKSQNAPHIYAVAESAYRDAFHHEKQQHILFAGETGSGKTVNMMHAIDHLLFLGQGLKSAEKLRKSFFIIHAMGNASTPHNENSTRHVLKTQLTFTNTGKVSGGIFRIYQLEKERIITPTKNQSNFHILYFFFDFIKSTNNLNAYYLDNQTSYKLLNTEKGIKKGLNSNIEKFKLFENYLRELDFEEYKIDSIKNILAAIILLGQVEFTDDEEGNGIITTTDLVNNVADLLCLDRKKLCWALVNYCFIVKGEAMMRHNSKEEAEEARNVLIKGIYSRLVDWVINTINEKLSVSRLVYGDQHIITLLDFYGFECYKRNTLGQLFVNTFNEQLQFHYNQKVLEWDKQVASEEGIPFPNIDFYDNKEVIDLIMSKPDGLLHKIDEATRNEESLTIIECLPEVRTSPIFVETLQLFSIKHYTGKLTYDSSDMRERNRDFLPPELIDTMRLSENEVIKELFSSLLSKSGNLSTHFQAKKDEKLEKKRLTDKKADTNPVGQYSQTRQMRTAATTFRSTCMDLLKSLTSNGSFHFVRCLRTDLSDKPASFHSEVVRQQLRALAVVSTVLTIQQGYSYSVSFSEFMRRYKFMAFDFDENVEETKDNCRLLLLRLKMEGWTIGRTKVLLKYYNKEYLSRLYETQIKKIVKVQSMMRAFMTRRKLYAKIRKYQVNADRIRFKEETSIMTYDPTDSKHFEENETETSLPHLTYENLDEKQIVFIKPWYKRWRSKTIFQVLLLYRANRLQALVNFCLQIHLYNQNIREAILRTNFEINSKEIDFEAAREKYVPPAKHTPFKLPFDWASFIQKGDVNNCEPLPECNLDDLESTVQNVLNTKEFQKHQNEQDPEDKNISMNKDSVEDQENKKEFLQISAKETEETKNEVERPLTIESDPNSIHKPEVQIIISKNTIKNMNNNETIAKKVPDSPKKVFEKKVEVEVKKHPQFRPVTLKPKQSIQIPRSDFQSSLRELESKFQKITTDDDGDDKPPFNFRSMLRKTNFPIVPTPFTNETTEYDFIKKRKSLTCISTVIREPSEIVTTELLPGIFVHGKIADL